MPIILYKKGGSLNEREGPLRANVLPKIPGLTFWQLRAKPMAYFIWPWCLPGGYSAQAIKECIVYERKSADNSYVLKNFCKLLSLTYYNTSLLTATYNVYNK